MPGKRKVTEIIFGAPLDPLSKETRRHVVLVAFLASLGLGADGLSSSCYGPEEAFLALGEHRQLGLYLAIATGVTVFIIAVAYNQVDRIVPVRGRRVQGPYEPHRSPCRSGFGCGSDRRLHVDDRDIGGERGG